MFGKAFYCGIVPALIVAVSFTAAATRVAVDERSSPPAPTRKALLIGIGVYDNKSFPTLEFTQNDVARMAELLGSKSRQYGFEVMTMTDMETDASRRPTKGNIKTAIQKFLVEGTKPGDVRLLYYTGHGSWIRNRLSDEDDERDETLVPMDAVRPVLSEEGLKDIRDKELVEWLSPIVTPRIALTLIIDSCHSGSALKGGVGDKEIDGIDSFDLAKSPTELEKRKPEENGALVLTAAKDYQIAGGGSIELNGVETEYSHFTGNLLKALYRTPAHLISADALFQEVAARMSSEGMTAQTPEIKGSELRRAQTIFGGATAGSTGRARGAIATERVNDFMRETRKYLRAGVADGVETGVELQRIIPASPKVRIRVTKAGIGRSEFEVIGSRQPADGDTFEQVTWITKGEPNLTVWLPPAVLTEQELLDASAELRRIPGGSVAPEPVGETVPRILFAEKRNAGVIWRTHTDGDGLPTLTEAVLNRSEPRGYRPNRSFVNLPPSDDLRKAIIAEVASIGDLAIADAPEKATYELAGRPGLNGAVEYAWVLRAATTPENQDIKTALKGAAGPAVLPRITNWTRNDEHGSAAKEMRTLAFKLGNIRRLINLSSPIAMGSKKFPYKLEVRDSASRIPVPSGGEVDVTKEHDYLLKRVRSSTEAPSEFFAYLINIDRDGASVYEKFEIGSGTGANGRKFNPLRPPREIALLSNVTDPQTRSLGSETLILLLTDQALPKPEVLAFGGVRQLAAEKKNVASLADLLKALGMGMSAKGTTPDSWAVQRIVLKSVR